MDSDSVALPSATASNSLGRVLHAAHFAAIKHRKQVRKDQQKTPYINHPLGVAHVLYYEGGIDDDEVLMAAILHDTVEDTNTTFDELEQHFGQNVAQIVDECTDDKHKSKEDRKRLQIETAPHKSQKAKLVKMADKIYNLRDLQRSVPIGWTPERVSEYFEWAKKVTDGCVDASPKLAAVLDKIYKDGPKF